MTTYNSLKITKDLFKCLVVALCILFVAVAIKGSAICDDVEDNSCKVDEVPRRPITIRVCGDQLRLAFDQVCTDPVAARLRKVDRKRAFSWLADDVVWEKRRANEFLASSDPAHRVFTAVEECCIEGCIAEELQEYC